MGLHLGRGALAGALALWVVGCAADAADVAGDEAVDESPVQALQADVSSADQGSSPARPTGSGRAPTEDVADPDAEEDGNQGRADPRSTSGWDPASVSRFCFLLDERMQFLCRVTLTDCTKPARPLDIFTQVLCQLRGFLPGAQNASTGAPDTSSATGESASASGASAWPSEAAAGL